MRIIQETEPCDKLTVHVFLSTRNMLIKFTDVGTWSLPKADSSFLRLVMSAQQIKSLLDVPNWPSSRQSTTEYLDQVFPAVESLDQLEVLLEQTQIRHEDLQVQVRNYLRVCSNAHSERASLAFLV